MTPQKKTSTHQPKLALYDSSLRDGLQGEKIKLNLDEKLLVVAELDRLGLHYIEGGFPLASENELAFFKRVQKLPLKHAKIASFGSTRSAGETVKASLHLKALLGADTPVTTIVGKTWKEHVRKVLKTTLNENLAMIEESVAWLKKHDREVVYDAEHFFNGFQDDPEYAIKTLKAACAGGADIVVLCDTNGGMIHYDVIAALKRVQAEADIPRFGIHLHNDTGFAVANSLMAVDYGCEQIQGTLNGWGERCGNTNLALVMGNLHFKMGIRSVTDKQIRRLTFVSHRLNEIANIPNDDKLGYVGKSAFAHKAGQHADVILKSANLMEHMESSLVGNSRRVLLSELAGRATVSVKMKRFGDFDKQSPEVKSLTEVLKHAEQEGYEYEAAEASFDLIIRRTLKKHRPLFKLIEYGVSIESERTEQTTQQIPDRTNAFVRLNINGQEVSGIASDKGPVGSLDKALRKALLPIYPFMRDVFLFNYKVRVIDGLSRAASSRVRVLIETRSSREDLPFKRWETIGVSENIIDASWQALVDAFEFIYNEIS